ncbi:MAG TPA: YdcF family protein [Dokdonella sp.]
MLLLTKALTELTYPLTLAFVLVPAGLLLRRRCPRFGRALAGLGFGWVLLWSLPLPSFWLRSALERRYPERAADAYAVADAIVVLGGGVEGPREGWREGPHLGGAADRVWFAARLFAAGRAPRLILTGGAGLPAYADGPEAEAMAQFARDLGVPDDALLLERESRTTAENAAYVRRLMDQHGIARVLLVTSALHMPRALATFRKAGIDAVPAPTDFEALPPRGPWLLCWLPDAGTLDASTRALKEWLGLFVYRLRGQAE